MMSQSSSGVCVYVCVCVCVCVSWIVRLPNPRSPTSWSSGPWWCCGHLASRQTRWEQASIEVELDYSIKCVCVVIRSSLLVAHLTSQWIAPHHRVSIQMTCRRSLIAHAHASAVVGLASPEAHHHTRSLVAGLSCRQQSYDDEPLWRWVISPYSI